MPSFLFYIRSSVFSKEWMSYMKNSIKSTGGKYSTSRMVVDYVNDTKNGYVISLSNEYAGFGGDKYFVKNDLSFKQSFSFWDNEWMFGILVDAGKIHSLNEKVLSRSDRYLLGGDSLRGFEYGGIGARNLFCLRNKYVK